MTLSSTKTSRKLGMPPGSLIHVGDVLETSTRMTVIDYRSGNIEEQPLQSIRDTLKYRDSDSVTWVIIEGLADVEIVEDIGTCFGIHELVLEDILNTHQRPKFEDYEDYLYVALKCLLLEEEQFSVSHEQISLLILRNFIFTFKEKKDDLLAPVRQQIKTSKGRFLSQGSGYLGYAILDTVIDQGFALIDSLDEAISALEDSLLSTEPTPHTLHEIQKLKWEIITIRRHYSPTRELMAGMLRTDSELIHEKTRIYLRDVSDHAIRVIESIESYREILSGLLEIYISSVSNKLNEIMKVLTVFASIFIPLTFLAGIYGMNFDYMPELKWKWAYPVLWLVFITIPAVLLVYFKKKKWL